MNKKTAALIERILKNNTRKGEILNRDSVERIILFTRLDRHLKVPISSFYVYLICYYIALTN